MHQVAHDLHISYVQAFSQIGVEAACGRPLFQENCLIFRMLPLKFFI